MVLRIPTSRVASYVAFNTSLAKGSHNEDEMFEYPIETAELNVCVTAHRRDAGNPACSQRPPWPHRSRCAALP